MLISILVCFVAASNLTSFNASNTQSAQKSQVFSSTTTFIVRETVDFEDFHTTDPVQLKTTYTTTISTTFSEPSLEVVPPHVDQPHHDPTPSVPEGATKEDKHEDKESEEDSDETPASDPEDDKNDEEEEEETEDDESTPTPTIKRTPTPAARINTPSPIIKATPTLSDTSTPTINSRQRIQQVSDPSTTQTPSAVQIVIITLLIVTVLACGSYIIYFRKHKKSYRRAARFEREDEVATRKRYEDSFGPLLSESNRHQSYNNPSWNPSHTLI